MTKPFSQACENNKYVIGEVLAPLFDNVSTVVEIGSGTGQHAVFFAEQFPHLTWQPSDLVMNLPGIRKWMADAPSANILPPLHIDVAMPHWPVSLVPAFYSANTVHIMAWPLVEMLFAGVSRYLAKEGLFCLYGPFNYDGKYTSNSNAEFDCWLKARDRASGIRDFEQIESLANSVELAMVEDVEMPANNRLLVFRQNSG